MTNLSYTSNGGRLLGANPRRKCPLCNKDSSCSFNQDYSIILCHRQVEKEVSATNGQVYRFISYAEKGTNTTWAVYGLKRERDANFESAINRQDIGYVKADETKKGEGSTLTSEARNEAYRKIAGSYTKLQYLMTEQLKGKRELTTKEIDYLVKEQVIFEWDNQRDVRSLGLPLDLPGVNTNMKGSRLCGSNGMFIAAVDQKGNIVGGQIAASDRSKGKYKAVSSNSFGGKSWHLEGEWPIAYWDFASRYDIHNDGSRKDLDGTVWLCEGFLKSLVLGTKLNRHNKNYRVIGASGGQFWHSYRQLKGLLKGVKKVILCADKGSIKNKAVIDNYLKLKKTLTNWGVTTDVLFFTHADCDELQDHEYITLASQTKEWAEFESLFNEYVKPQEEVNKLNERKENYLAKKVLTNVDFLSDTEYLDIPVPNEGDIILVKSPLGTGKTTYLDRVLAAYKYGWLLIGYRNNLLMETCNNRSKNGVVFSHLHENQMYSQMADPNANIAFCVDSLPNWSMERLEGRPLIIDEAKSVMIHILTSTTRVKDDRINNLNKLKEAIRMSPMVILLDATADEATYKFYQELAGGRKVITYENKASQKERFTVHISDGINSKGEAIADKSHLVKQILNSDGNIAVFSDSRRECEAINELEQKRGRKTLLITSETVTEDEVKVALGNLNAYLKDNKIQTFIYSPSGESGIDISIKKYFDAVYGLYYGVIPIDSCMQMLGRVRDTNVPRFISVPKTGIGESEDLFSIQVQNRIISNVILDAAYTFEDSNIKDALQSILKNAIGESVHWSFKYIAAFNADLALEKKFFRELFLKRLEQLGMNVFTTMSAVDEELKRVVKEEKEEAKLAYATAIFNEEDIDEDDYKYLSAKYSLSIKEQRQVKKYALKLRLPDIEKTELWTAELVKDLLIDNPQRISQLERLMDIEMPEFSVQKGKERWTGYLSRKELSLTDIKHNTAIVKTLEKVGVKNFLETGLKFSDGHKGLEELKRKCSNPDIQKLFGLKPGKQSAIRFFGLLIEKFFGLKLVRFRISSNGKQINQYVVEPLNETYQEIIFDCLMKKNLKVMERADKLPEPLMVQEFQASNESRKV